MSEQPRDISGHIGTYRDNAGGNVETFSGVMSGVVILFGNRAITIAGAVEPIFGVVAESMLLQASGGKL